MDQVRAHAGESALTVCPLIKSGRRDPCPEPSSCPDRVPPDRSIGRQSLGFQQASQYLMTRPPPTPPWPAQSLPNLSVLMTRCPAFHLEAQQSSEGGRHLSRHVLRAYVRYVMEGGTENERWPRNNGSDKPNLSASLPAWGRWACAWRSSDHIVPAAKPACTLNSMVWHEGSWLTRCRHGARGACAWRSSGHISPALPSPLHAQRQRYGIWGAGSLTRCD